MSPEAAAKRRRGASARPRCPPPAEQWRLRPRHTPRAEAGASHVEVVGGARVTWARGAGPAAVWPRGFPGAACDWRPFAARSFGSAGLAAGLREPCGPGRSGSGQGRRCKACARATRRVRPEWEQAFPALSRGDRAVERLFLPEVAGPLEASRGGSMESEVAARVVHN